MHLPEMHDEKSFICRGVWSKKFEHCSKQPQIIFANSNYTMKQQWKDYFKIPPLVTAYTFYCPTDSNLCHLVSEKSLYCFFDAVFYI